MKQILLFIFIFGAAIALPTSPEKQDGRVIGSTTPAKLGELPWVAGVFESRFFNCGGALISPQFVLTSADCVNGGVKPPPPGYFSVQLGDLKSGFNPLTNTVVQSVIIHPGYVPSAMHHRNIALLDLGTDVSLTPYVNVIALPTLTQIPIGDHTDVSLAGWGDVFAPNIALHFVELQTMPIDTCIDVLGGEPSIEHDYNVCTAGYSSTTGLPSGACEEDHGAPLVWNYASKPLLVGIVSQGDCKTPGTRIPTVYSSTFGHNREWIRMITGIAGPREI